jgi:hypothetical protein
MLSEDARVKVGRAVADVLTEMSQAYALAPEESKVDDEETETSVRGKVLSSPAGIVDV